MMLPSMSFERKVKNGIGQVHNFSVFLKKVRVKRNCAIQCSKVLVIAPNFIFIAFGLPTKGIDSLGYPLVLLGVGRADRGMNQTARDCQVRPGRVFPIVFRGHRALA